MKKLQLERLLRLNSSSPLDGNIFCTTFPIFMRMSELFVMVLKKVRN